MQDSISSLDLPTHVVGRLSRKIREARAMGFQVRQEVLGSHAGNWCEIAGRKIVFLDITQSASEQLSALEDALGAYRPSV